MTIRTDEKRNRTVEVANPDLGGTGVEVERAFFVDLGGRIRRRKDLDANVRGACEDNWILVNFGATGCEPGYIDRLDAIGGRYRTLRQCLTLRQERGQSAQRAMIARAFVLCAITMLPTMFQSRTSRQLLIGTIAMHHNLILVTRNVRDAHRNGPPARREERSILGGFYSAKISRALCVVRFSR